MSTVFRLEPADKALVYELIETLSKKVANHLSETTIAHGLLSGLAGELLFLFKAHQFNPEFVDESVFQEQLDVLQEGLGEQSLELSNGLAGQAWLLEYFNQSTPDEYDPELLSEIDELFTNALKQSPWSGELEMVLGLAGYSPYAARRARHADQTELFDAIVSGFESTVSQLNLKHLTWAQPKESVYLFDRESKDAEYNLGLAHGVPGIIAALLPAVRVPSLTLRTKRLLEGGCEWLLTQRNPKHDDYACFGTCVGDQHRSRLGWCYGDLTIALTLARVGLELQRDDFIESALEISLHSASRDESSAVIYDAGLCHGSLGLATIFQAMNQLLPHPELAAAADRWLHIFLTNYKEKGESALYFYDAQNKCYTENFGFLMGYSGMALSLIGVMDDQLDWIDSLLMA